MAQSTSGPFKTIIFDLGKVIVDFDHLSSCRKASKFCSLSPEEIHQRVFSLGLEDKFDRGLLTPDQFYEAACTVLGLCVDRALFKSLWNDIFSPIPGMETIISRLSRKPFRLLCLSNTNPWHFDHCRENFSVLSRFHAFVLSYAVGAKKPDKLIFQKALEEARARPEQCLYIDDVADFTRCAEKMGISTITFESAAKLEKDLEGRKVL